jgi:rubredoxin
MAQVVALEDIPPHWARQRSKAGNGAPGAVISTFFKGTPEAPIHPHAAFNEYEAGEERISAAHYHQVDQFQVIVRGKGMMGRHAVAPHAVHFSRAHTPYGPLHSDKDEGWAFIVMRARFDPGAQRFPESRERLKQIPNRRPWHLTRQAEFPAPAKGIAMADIPGMRDDDGLFARTLVMAAGEVTHTTDTALGDGQYLTVLKGSLVHEGRELQAPTLVFVRPDEPAFRIEAGPQGLEAIILNFPRVQQAAAAKPPAGRLWQCGLCAFAYDEAAGLPAEGIAPGTPWDRVPQDWTCPDCNAAKKDFEFVNL